MRPCVRRVLIAIMESAVFLVSLEPLHNKAKAGSCGRSVKANVAPFCIAGTSADGARMQNLVLETFLCFILFLELSNFG